MNTISDNNIYDFNCLHQSEKNEDLEQSDGGRKPGHGGHHGSHRPEHGSIECGEHGKHLGHPGKHPNRPCHHGPHTFRPTSSTLA
ncbi:unnamed protein product [Adineta steineri]|uniref:Uncharacterized protein n=1 Tax=Adineta steineri TaxID=433720 RepID=A0A816A996_9BILA|nr:unnamed protein product [Adineta steineri]CAF1593787.1 unnamed protein product [Adineta steineri]